MKRILSIIALLSYLLITVSYGQPNCNWYKYQGDMKKYEACLAAEKRAGHYQFSKEYQLALDNAIDIDSTWAYAYRAKSTAYLKSGDFITWKKLMDTAVKYDTIDNLDYRGWCRFQFFRDYHGAIDDLLLLKKVTNNKIGYSVNGDYHLDIALALCYKYIGQKDKALSLILEKLSDSTLNVGIYDYLHLGVLYLEIGEFGKAIECLKFQESINDLSENRFYIAMAYRHVKDKENYLLNLNISKSYYQSNRKMFDPYTEQIDKIYLENIIEEERNGLQQAFGDNGG
jgi:tetratricopeptide (TPR) repeat protein